MTSGRPMDLNRGSWCGCQEVDEQNATSQLDALANRIVANPSICLLFFSQKCQCNELCAIKIRSVQHKVHRPCISPMRFAKHGGARRRYDDKYMRVTNMSS